MIQAFVTVPAYSCHLPQLSFPDHSSLALMCFISFQLILLPKKSLKYLPAAHD